MSTPESMMEQPTSRRVFLAALPAALGALAAGFRPRTAFAAPHGVHPDPRPGIDASEVLTAEELGGMTHVIPVFDQVREIPHIADGLRCYCGCADLEGYRSLLSCYEGDGMAQYCDICQGEGRLAHSRWKEGQGLEQIRHAIDARYGPGR